MQAGMPVYIMILLAEVHTLKNDKGMHKRKENAGDWNFLSDLHPPVQSHAVLLGSLGLLHRWNGGHTLFSEWWLTFLAVPTCWLDRRC
jgi:hypothetical protein